MKITYPENSAHIIQEIIEKYGFLEIAKKEADKLANTRDNQESEEIFKNLPNYKIAKIIGEYAEGLVSSQNFPSLLKEELKTSEKLAEQISKELREKIIPFIKIEKTTQNGEKIEHSGIKLGVEETDEIKKSELNNDTYREPVE